jgi:biofilm PGA synthesis N-glycosyltransferase PgaC
MITVALIPAHNEEKSIAETVRALQEQSLVPDRIIVVADNCTDGTVLAAKEAGAEVYESQDNTEMKAGALNQALAVVLPGLADTDLVTCIDADTLVGSNYLSEAARNFGLDPTLGGVSGTYQGRTGGRFVGWCQRNEFSRWGFDNRNQRGRTVILSGAASVFTVAALRRVISARAEKTKGRGRLKGEGVYNTGTITEDFELSMALLHTGSRIRNMLNVTINTAIKPTWRELHVQRLRWDRGINESLFAYGITKHTHVVWRRRVLYSIYVPVSFMCLALVGFRLVTGLGYQPNLFWIGIAAIMMFQKAATIVRTRGVWNAIGAFLLLTELPYDTFLQATFVRSLADGITNRNKKWR